MNITIDLAPHRYQIDLTQRFSLAIALDFSQQNQQPNHFSAMPAQANPMQAGSFIGDTRQGGSCNVNQLQLNPHCNGTHTETIAHICHLTQPHSQTIAQLALPLLMPCVLISVAPEHAINSQDSYQPEFEAQDQIISQQQLQSALAKYDNQQLQCVIIRTLPNNKNKCQQHYHQDTQPAFFSHESIAYLNQRGVEHLIVDIPSLDRLDDNGLLSCHHLFWQIEQGSQQAQQNCRADKTITELAYIDNNIIDDVYMVNLQLPAFVNDAAPSQPVLYPVTILSNSTDTSTQLQQ